MRAVGFLVVVAGLLVGSLAHAQAGKYADTVKKAKATLTKDFKDPSSAQFRNLGIYKSETGKGGVSVCGEVNSKNSFGAYVGFQRFFVWQEMVEIEGVGSGYKTLGPALCHELVTAIR